jgi:hypothetical protein
MLDQKIVIPAVEVETTVVNVQTVVETSIASTATLVATQKSASARPPALLKGYTLIQLLSWYEEHLCNKEIIDPRGNQVAFDLTRFCYMVKLVDKQGRKLIKPLWYAQEIKAGRLTEADFGGFHQHRAETLSWLSWLIENPLNIRENVCLHVPGEEVYVKEVNPKHRERYKLLYCDRVGESLLVPVSAFRQKNEPRGKIIWP